MYKTYPANWGMIENRKWGTLKNEKQKDFTEGR